MGTIAKSWLALKWKKKWYFTFFHQACTEPVESLSRHRDAVLRLKKKLEAPRQGFYNDVFATQGVGCVCVITTGELELLVKEKSWSISVPVVNN